MQNVGANPGQDSNNEFDPNPTETLSVSQFEQVEEHFRFGWSIKGRRGRLAYIGYKFFIAILMVCAFFLGVAAVSMFVYMGRYSCRFVGFLTSYIVVAKPNITNMGRRFHDTNISAIWAYIIYGISFFAHFIPFGELIIFVAELYLIFCPGTEGSNTYGEVEPS